MLSVAPNTLMQSLSYSYKLLIAVLSSVYSKVCFFLSAAPLISAAAYWGVPAVAAPLVPCEPPVPPVPALPPQPPLPPSQPPFEPPGAKALPADKTKKVKKDKVSIGIKIFYRVSKEGSR